MRIVLFPKPTVRWRPRARPRASRRTVACSGMGTVPPRRRRCHRAVVPRPLWPCPDDSTFTSFDETEALRRRRQLHVKLNAAATASLAPWCRADRPERPQRAGQACRVAQPASAGPRATRPTSTCSSLKYSKLRKRLGFIFAACPGRGPGSTTWAGVLGRAVGASARAARAGRGGTERSRPAADLPGASPLDTEKAGAAEAGHCVRTDDYSASSYPFQPPARRWRHSTMHS